MRLQVTNLAVQFSTGNRYTLTAPKTVDGLMQICKEHTFITAELIAYFIVVMVVSLQERGSPFEHYSSNISTSDLKLGYFFNWVLVKFLYRGQENNYFPLPGCDETEEKRELFVAKRQAAIGQLAIVTKALVDSGTSIPVYTNYLFQRPKRDEDFVHDGSGDGEDDFSEDQQSVEESYKSHDDYEGELE